jgi:hypothetical protein
MFNLGKVEFKLGDLDLFLGWDIHHG